MSLGPEYANKQVKQILGDSANKYTMFIFGHGNERWNMPQSLKFKWDGWLIGYRYPKSKYPDPDPLMRHHLRYNYGCRSDDDEPEGSEGSDRIYQGEPDEGHVFTWPLDHRHLDIKVKIDPWHFCDINTDWTSLLGDKLPQYAKCFSKEQERLYLIDMDNYYWIINYEYS